MRKTYRAIIRLIRFLLLMSLLLFMVMVFFQPEGLVRIFKEYYSSFCFAQDTSLKVLFVTLTLIGISYILQFLIALKSWDRTQKITEYLKTAFDDAGKNPYIKDFNELSFLMVGIGMLTLVFTCD